MNKIIAVAAAAVIGVAGYLYKIWADKVKSRKLVLFYLLEIHYVLKVLPVSTDGLVERYLEYCKGLLKNAGLPIDENYDEMIEKIAPHIHVYFENLYSAIPSSLDAKFQESFDSSLEALAKDNPVLAYRLKGRQCLEKISQAVKSYTVDLKSQPGVTDNKLIGFVIKDEITASANTAYAEILKEVNDDILTVARVCGPLTYWNCRKAIKKKVELDDDFSNFGLGEMFTSYMTKIIAEAKRNALSIISSSTS
jgi:hypothetical protein